MQKAPSGHHRITLSGYIFATKAYIDNRKKLFKHQYLLQMSLQYGELRPTNGWDRLAGLGHPIIFQRVSRLGSVIARQSHSGRQPNFAALNRGRHLRLAGRPSRWALAHILVLITFGRNVTGKVRNQKMLYFPPHLTSASTVPGDRGNAEIASFHLNVACYFASKRRKHTEIAPGHSWTTIHCQNDPLCIRQDLRGQHSTQQYVKTLVLDVYQVCHGGSRCVKNWSCSSSSLGWKSMDSVAGIWWGYLTISTNVR